MKLIPRLISAKRKAVDYILDTSNGDGSFGPIEEGFFFYRLPWTFTVAGETAAAASVCQWVRDNMLTADGDFDQGLRKLTDAYAYRNATFIYGSHMARQFDLSFNCMPFLLSLQDPVSGGFSNDMEASIPGDAMDVPYTVGSGLACIATGHLNEALRVYNYLRQVWSQQDDLPDKLYYNFSKSNQNIIKDFNSSDRFWNVVIAQEPLYQRWTVGGIAAAFIVRLYMAIRDPEMLDLARKYMQFSIDSTEKQFNFAPVCKSGWGSSLLYQITGDMIYKKWTMRLGEWFIDTQSPDGTWREFREGGSEGDQIHLAAEFAVHIDTIIAALSSKR